MRWISFFLSLILFINQSVAYGRPNTLADYTLAVERELQSFVGTWNRASSFQSLINGSLLIPAEKAKLKARFIKMGLWKQKPVALTFDPKKGLFTFDFPKEPTKMWLLTATPSLWFYDGRTVYSYSDKPKVEELFKFLIPPSKGVYPKSVNSKGALLLWQWIVPSAEAQLGYDNEAALANQKSMTDAYNKDSKIAKKTLMIAGFSFLAFLVILSSVGSYLGNKKLEEKKEKRESEINAKREFPLIDRMLNCGQERLEFFKCGEVDKKSSLEVIRFTSINGQPGKEYKFDGEKVKVDSVSNDKANSVAEKVARAEYCCQNPPCGNSLAKVLTGINGEPQAICQASGAGVPSGSSTTGASTSAVVTNPRGKASENNAAATNGNSAGSGRGDSEMEEGAPDIVIHPSEKEVSEKRRPPKKNSPVIDEDPSANEAFDPSVDEQIYPPEPKKERSRGTR